MKHCLQCKKEIDLVGDFCSEKCSNDWQALNQKCGKCGNTIDLLEDDFKVENNGEQEPKIICITCYDKENNNEK